jgi:hypothetical protein
MKTIIYNKDDGSILNFIDEKVELSGLSSGQSYIKSESATGSELNISEILDSVHPERIISGDKISQESRDAFNSVTTISQLKSVLSSILFGD